MFKKTKINVFKKLFELANPGRKISLIKVGRDYILIHRDKVGCNDYLLKGKYTYDQVVELNKKTGYNAGFGFCKELGPVAFIGVPNYKCVQKNGFFEHEVQGYGESINNDEYYFEQYSDEDAKNVDNYIVYGMNDPRVLNNTVPIEKVHYIYDYRFNCKNESFNENFNLDVLDMDIKLGGTYSFYGARKFAYNSFGKFKGSSGENVPIQFAIVGDNQPVGILNLWDHYDNAMFRDVWGLNEDEPEKQTIHFLSDEEAKKINKFKLYYYCPSHSFGTKKFVIEKKDRTLEKGFNYMMSDGTDYRLQNGVEKHVKTKVLTN